MLSPVVVVLVAAVAVVYFLVPIVAHGQQQQQQRQDLDNDDDVNNNNNDTCSSGLGTATTAESVLERLCGEPDVTCHEALVADGRTHRVDARSIAPGEIILSVPRRLQIWTLDALRDPFVGRELLAARRMPGNIPLTSGAFMAAYLARVRKTIINDSSNNAAAAPALQQLPPVVRQQWIRIFPTRDDFARFHPFLWTEEDFDALLGTYTFAYDSVQVFVANLRNEYEAFCRASRDFEETISMEDYEEAKLWVLTRTFAIEQHFYKHEEVSRDEMDHYRTTAGIDISHQTVGLVPALDMYDHHPAARTKRSYDEDRSQFVLTATGDGGIPSGSQVSESYGVRSDAELFAQWGFVNGDGSGSTQASIAVYHKVDLNPIDVVARRREERKQRLQVLRYLQHDNGYYPDCVDPNAQPREAWELKVLKYKYLVRWANRKSSWIVDMPPRNPNPSPFVSSDVPITLDPPKVNLDKGNLERLLLDNGQVVATCRVIAVTHLDYRGGATSMLRANVHNPDFVFPPRSRSGSSRSTSRAAEDDEDDDDIVDRALEYRTLSCVKRLAGAALERFGLSVEEQADHVAHLNRHAFGTRNWTASHVRLGEMQTLRALYDAAAAAAVQHDGLEAYNGNNKNKEEEIVSDSSSGRTTKALLYHVREEICLEARYLLPLLQHAANM